MSMDWVKDVREFHEKFGCYIAEYGDGMPEEVRELRLSLVEEEHNELMVAMKNGDLAGIADALVDGAYVEIGSCISAGAQVWTPDRFTDSRQAGLPHRSVVYDYLGIVSKATYRVLAEIAWNRPGFYLGSYVTDSLQVKVVCANHYGIDLRPVWDAVHAANMAKEGGGSREDGKILKPAGWVPPDIAGILGLNREASPVP